MIRDADWIESLEPRVPPLFSEGESLQGKAIKNEKTKVAPKEKVVTRAGEKEGGKWKSNMFPCTGLQADSVRLALLPSFPS